MFELIWVQDDEISKINICDYRNFPLLSASINFNISAAPEINTKNEKTYIFDVIFCILWLDWFLWNWLSRLYHFLLQIYGSYTLNSRYCVVSNSRQYFLCLSLCSAVQCLGNNDWYNHITFNACFLGNQKNNFCLNIFYLWQT